MFDYRFADRAALNLLMLIPLLVFLLWWMRHRTKAILSKVVDPKLMGFLTRTVAPSRRTLKIWLQAMALGFFVLALARPQSGEGKQKAKNEGLEIMLVVDVSNSMLAEDVRPSRLELAQKELSRFVDGLGGDKVGLVAFAGSAILLSPMTADKSALKMFLESLTPEAVTSQGTNFKKALSEAYMALRRGGNGEDEQQPSGATKVIVVASDGEDNEVGGLDTAKKISDEGIRIFTLGFGTANGGQIPVRDKNGNLVGYKKDKSNKTIVSKSTGEALKALAEAGKGSYQQVTFGGDAVLNLRRNIDQLQKAQFETMEVSHYNEHYQGFLFVGLILALLEFALGERKSEGRIWRGRFEVPLE
ncbi:MAG: VWA domain-containing protein [Bdellovibrionales bacterium]